MTEKLDMRIRELERENRLLKISFCTCRYCRNADLYIPAYTYPFFDPRCKISRKSINPDDCACEDFAMSGRKCR